MNKDGMALSIVALFLILMTYMSWVGTNINQEKFENSPSILPKPEVQSSYELPELTQEEKAKVDSIHKSMKKQAAQEVEKKSVEQMRDEVHEILDEIIETDSTVVITFKMQVNNPLAYETKEK